MSGLHWSHLPLSLLFCHPHLASLSQSPVYFFWHNLSETWFSVYWAPILVQATILIPHCRDLPLTLCPPSSPSYHQQPEREKRSHLLFKVFRALLLGIKIENLQGPVWFGRVPNRHLWSDTGSNSTANSARATAGGLFQDHPLEEFLILCAGSDILYKGLLWEGHSSSLAT